MSRYIPDKDRNAFFKEFCKQKANKSCVDCNAPNPQWATAYFGILFCLECSGKHRSLGTHLTFVRSITMDSWRPQEIAAMQAGGNANMIAWWKAHDVDPRAPIATKYGHQATQNYRAKIKAMVAGEEYVEPAPSSTGSVRKSPKSLSSSRGSSGSSGEALRKSKKKSSKKSSAVKATPVTGQMFSFDDAPGVGAEEEDESDDSFESFVSAQPKKTVHAVPNYSDARLKEYEGARSFGSDDLNGTKKTGGVDGGADGDLTVAVDDMFAALGAGWSRLTEVTTAVASQTKEKLVEGTSGLKNKVGQTEIGGKASSFIASLWAGMEPEQQQERKKQEEEEEEEEVGLDREVAGDDDGWGAWDGNAAASSPPPVAAEDAWGAWGAGQRSTVNAPPPEKKEDAWGAWGASPAEEPSAKPKKKEKKTKKKSSPPPLPEEEVGSAGGGLLIDLGGAAPSAPAAAGDGWEDFAFDKKE